LLTTKKNNLIERQIRKSSFIHLADLVSR
jgi:hypothetical protein